MQPLLSFLSRRRTEQPRNRTGRKRLAFDWLEDRVVPAGDILVSTDATNSPGQFLKEYTAAGTLVGTVAIPPGNTAEDARDLVADSSGKILVYNGTFDPYLSTYNPATSTWSQTTYSGWSTVNNVSYGGIGLWGNYAFVTDMSTGPTATQAAQGIIRFDRNAGTATRFATDIGPDDLTVGLDGKLYALAGNTVYVYDPATLTQQGTVTLPFTVNGVYEDYRGIAVNAAGDVFAATWNNEVIHFDSAGVVKSSVTLTGPGGGALFGNLTDIDVSSDGELLVGSRFGHVVRMKDDFSSITYLTVSSAPTFVAFAPLPTVGVADVNVTEGDSATTATFTLKLSAPESQAVTVHYATSDGTAKAGSDYTATSGTVNFSPGETTKTVNVTILGDTVPEPTETFNFTLSNPSAGLMLGRAQAIGIIADNDVTQQTVGLTSSGMAREYWGSSTFTQFVGGDYSLSVRKFDFDAGSEPVDERTIMEFNTNQVDASRVGAVTLDVNENSYTSSSQGVKIYAYSGDGTAGLDDATRTAALVGSYNPTTGLGPKAISLDRGAIASLLGKSSYIGLVMVAVVDTNTSVDGPSTGTPPKLVFDYTAANSVPVANAGPDQTVNEGATVQFDGSQTTDADGDPITYSWDFGDGTTGGGVKPAHVYGDNGTYTVTMTADDGRGGVSKDSLIVTVNNVAPSASISGPTTGLEGSGLSFTASASDPAGANDPLTYAWSVTKDGSAFALPAGTNVGDTSFAFTPTDNGSYVVSLTVSDDDGGSTTVTQTVSVANVPPTASVSGPTGGVRGQTQTFTFGGSDVSPVDSASLTYTIDWGDGSATETVTAAAGSFQLSHVFAASGTFGVTVTVTDKDNGSGSATQNIGVVAAAVQNGDLIVGGTTSGDQITIRPADASGAIQVVINGATVGTFTPTGQVVVYGQDGDDTIQVASTKVRGKTYSVGLPVVLYGGGGNDTLDARGATGPAILLGGAGNDTLYGGSGRDILIGGAGSDVLHGSGDEDILIGGTTQYDDDLAALMGVRVEWANPNIGESTRIAALSAGLLKPGTVLDDGAVDYLYGDSGSDWIFVASGSTPDQMGGRKKGDTVTTI